MSRIADKPITIPEGVNIEITPSRVIATSGNNKEEMRIPELVNIAQEDQLLWVKRKNDSKPARALQGLAMRLLVGLINGVKEGFTKDLEFNGTGYRVAVAGNEVVLNMGYSHEIKLIIPEGLTVAVKKNNIIVTGSNKQLVGQFAAEIREVRGPEVYKGKGIKYKEEIIKRKAGKKAAS